MHEDQHRTQEEERHRVPAPPDEGGLRGNRVIDVIRGMRDAGAGSGPDKEPMCRRVVCSHEKSDPRA